MQNNSVARTAQLGLFAALIFLLGLTPLGFIILPFAGITTIHMPVIIGGYLFGVNGGAFLGGVFGLVSLIRCFTTPDATAAILLGTSTGHFGIYNLFLILVILFVPHILTGVFSALAYRALHSTKMGETAAMGISAFIGSMTNTVLFLGGLYVFAFEQAAVGFGVAGASAGAFLRVLLGVAALNGTAEAVAAVLVCTAVGRALLVVQRYTLARN